MTQRIFWVPAANPSVASYNVFSAASPAEIAANPQALQATLQMLSYVPGTLQFIGNVPVNMQGPNFDIVSGRYFFDDVAGTPSTVYLVQGVGANQTILGDSGIFQAQQVQGASLVTRSRVDHNYGGVDELRYLTTGGQAVANATIRAFKQADYLAGKYDLALAVTQTDFDGRWLAPFFLEPGLTYVLLFENYGTYGPDRVDVTV